MPSENEPRGETERFFDAVARKYDRVYAPPRELTRERMDRVLRCLGPRSRVLDLGVGTGRELGALQDAGHAPTGVDVSKAMLEICARRARPVPLVRADFWTRLPFADASFDAVLALHGSLSHPRSEADLAPFAREMSRLLSPDGIVLFELPVPAWLDALEHSSPSPDDDVHVRRVGPQRLLHTDRATGASVGAHVFSIEIWARALTPYFLVKAEEIGPFEVLVRGQLRP